MQLKLKKSRKQAQGTAPKPIIPVPKPPPASGGPIFIATFADRVTTKMSIYSALEPLDLERGITIVKAAYSSRTGTPMSAITVPIVEARFETSDGVLLASYDAEQLEGRRR
jgi:hypothetical protein